MKQPTFVNGACTHPRIQHFSTGGMHFSPTFGPWDDIRNHAECPDCGRYWPDGDLAPDPVDEDEDEEEQDEE